MSSVIVGGEECPISTVISTLSVPEFFDVPYDKWFDVAKTLETPNHQLQQLGRDLILGDHSIPEVIEEIIESWVGRNGKDATIDDLIFAIQENGLTACAEALTRQFPGDHPNPYSIRLDMATPAKAEDPFSDEPPKSAGYMGNTLANPGKGITAVYGAIFHSLHKELLKAAAEGADMKIVRKLVRRGADVNVKDVNGMTPLHLAAHQAHLEEKVEASFNIIKFLIDNGANIYAKNKDKKNFFDKLHFNTGALTPSRFHELCKCLVFNGHIEFFSKMDEDNRYKITPIMWAVKIFEVETKTLRLLYEENGVDINMTDMNGWSILYWAIKGGRGKRLLRNLIQLGVDPKQKNKAGQTPMDYARQERKIEAISVLEEFYPDSKA